MGIVEDSNEEERNERDVLVPYWGFEGIKKRAEALLD